MTLADLVEDSVEIAGMYLECSARVDALIDYATGEQP